jgi:hypothetical protein
VGLFFRPRRPLLLLAAGAASKAAPHREPAETRVAGTDTTAELERLTRLHAAGALTDEEFTATKSRLLCI